MLRSIKQTKHRWCNGLEHSCRVAGDVGLSRARRSSFDRNKISLKRLSLRCFPSRLLVLPDIKSSLFSFPNYWSLIIRTLLLHIHAPFSFSRSLLVSRTHPGSGLETSLSRGGKQLLSLKPYATYQAKSASAAIISIEGRYWMYCGSEYAVEISPIPSVSEHLLKEGCSHVCDLRELEADMTRSCRSSGISLEAESYRDDICADGCCVDLYMIWAPVDMHTITIREHWQSKIFRLLFFLFQTLSYSRLTHFIVVRSVVSVDLGRALVPHRPVISHSDYAVAESITLHLPVQWLVKPH